MNAQQAIQELQDDAATFLRHNVLFIAGGYSNVSGPATFRMTEKTGFDAVGFTTGFSGLIGLKKDRQFWKIFKLAAYNAAPTANDEFNAYYVAMCQMTDPVPVSHYTLPSGAGHDLMLTSQITGCSFGVGSDSFGARIVSHIQYDKVSTQTAFDNVVTGGLANGTDALFKDGQDYDKKNEFVAIVGQRAATGLTWHVYAQLAQSPADSKGKTYYDIETVRQIA